MVISKRGSQHGSESCVVIVSHTYGRLVRTVVFVGEERRHGWLIWFEWNRHGGLLVKCVCVCVSSSRGMTLIDGSAKHGHGDMEV